MEAVQREVSMLNQENENLLRKLETKGGVSANAGKAEIAEASKRLKKRELECQALWDSIKELKTSGLND